MRSFIDNRRTPHAVRWIVLLALLLPFAEGQAQKGAEANTDEVPSGLRRITEPGSTRRWLDFQRDSRLHKDSFFSKHKIDLGLGAHDTMMLVKVSTDHLGYTRYRYQQYYQGVPVEIGHYLLHERDGYLKSANGRIASGLNLDIHGVLPSSIAQQAALNHVHGSPHDKRAALQRDTLTGTELIITPMFSSGTKADEFHLAYLFRVSPGEGRADELVYVDARRPVILGVRQTWMPICSTTTANTLYDGNSKTVNVDYRSGTNDFRLYSNCIGPNGTGTIHTRKWDGPGWSELTTATTYTTTGTWAQTGASAHWAAEQAYNYFYSLPNYNLGTSHRRGYNGSDGAITLYVNKNKMPDGRDNIGAYWYGGEIGCAPVGAPNHNHPISLDVIGHEFAHGVTQTEAGLSYQSESGALNESFSDIFGTMVEFYASANQGNYQIGEDHWTPDGKIRDMQDPSSKGDPEFYGGTNWVTTSGCTPDTSNDYCGVHTNSSVQNYWFYLLAQGTSGNISNGGRTFNVSGIGRTDAAAIAYRNLCSYLTYNSDYRDAREGSIRAARDLFGDCSNQLIQTAEAWYGVGVGNVRPPRTADTVLCSITYPSSATPVLEWGRETLTAGCLTHFDCVVSSGADVTFRASEKITMRAGFRTYTGSKFHAHITTCVDELDRPVIADNTDNGRGGDDALTGAVTSARRMLYSSPNPVSGTSLVTYVITEQGPVSLILYNALGEAVAELVDNSDHASGTYNVELDATRLSPGTYYYCLTTGSNRLTEKMSVFE